MFPSICKACTHYSTSTYQPGKVGRRASTSSSSPAICYSIQLRAPRAFLHYCLWSELSWRTCFISRVHRRDKPPFEIAHLSPRSRINAGVSQSGRPIKPTLTNHLIIILFPGRRTALLLVSYGTARPPQQTPSLLPPTRSLLALPSANDPSFTKLAPSLHLRYDEPPKARSTRVDCEVPQTRTSSPQP